MYKVYFVATLSNVKVATQNIVKGQKATKPNEVQVDGYNFKGWYADADYIEEFDFDEIKINKDTAIYLKYEKKKEANYDATFEANGGKYDDNTTSKVVKVKADEYFDMPIPTRDGYTFDGYMVDGVKFEGSKYTYTSDKTFTASWTPITYYVRYDGNGSDNDALESMAAEKVEYGKKYNLKANEFVKEGHTFKKWMLETTEYDEGQEVENLTTVKDQVITFKALWEAKSYTINYHNNGGSGTMASGNPTFGTAYTLTSNVFTNGNKTFLGWNTDKDAEKALYGNAASYDPKVYEAVVDLYAIWYEETPTTGKLIIDGNGGLVNGSSTYTILAEMGDSIEMPTVERTGYELAGYTENGTPYVIPQVMDFTGEKTIKASWSEITYNIIYNSNDANAKTIKKENIKYTEEVTIIGSMSYIAGKEFVNWNTDSLGSGTSYNEGDKVSKLSTTKGAVINLYAQYTNHKVTITFDPNTGVGTATSETYENNTNATLKANTFTKRDNTFRGWSRKADATAAQYNDGNLVDEKTLITLPSTRFIPKEVSP